MSTSSSPDFKELLNNQYNWPADYLFKFIVNIEHKQELLQLFSPHKVIEKLSSKGTYASITAQVFVHNADEVMDLYKKASKIQTVISL
jgi:hypothetical protein